MRTYAQKNFAAKSPFISSNGNPSSVKPLSRLSRLFMYKILQKQILKENNCVQLG